VHEESILCQFVKEQETMKSCNIMKFSMSTCCELTDSDSQVSETAETVSSLCHQCECIFMKLIKNIKTENKDIKIVVVIIDQIHIKKKVETKICYLH